MSCEEFWACIENLRRSLFVEENLKLFLERNESRSKENNRDRVKEKIEEIVGNCLESIMRNEAPSICFVNRRKWQNVSYQSCSGLEMKKDPIKSFVKFSSPNSTKRFVLILHVLAKIYLLIQTDTYSTKRDLYYQDVSLFGSQNVLNSIIDDITCLLRVPRRELHILATSKGCIAGDLRFKDGEGNFIDCSTSPSGMLVPMDVETIEDIRSEAKFLLIVEKDATFQKLLDENFTVHLNPCIIVTGKGFPDVNTRELVHKLWLVLQIPVLALADADPHGIEIVCIYRFGSLALAHDSSNLVVPCLKWIGVHPTDIRKLQLPDSTLLPLSKADTDRANDLLQRIYIQSCPEWANQIRELLRYKKKAEIQSLCGISDRFLCDVYLPAKIRLGDWI